MDPVSSMMATASASTSGSRSFDDRISTRRSRLGRRVLQGVHHNQRALALGDIAAEVLLLGLVGAHEVQQIVLDLEGEARVQPVAAQGLHDLVVGAAHDGAHGQRHRAGVMGRLVDGHGEIVLGRDVVAAVAGPAQIERLTLHRAAGHGDELLDNAHLHGVLEQRVVHHRTVYHGKRQVAHIDGQPQPLGEVQAGLAAAQLGLVGDVIVDEGR